MYNTKKLFILSFIIIVLCSATSFATTTWQSIGSFGSKVTTIAVDKHNNQIIYVGTAGNGIYKTTNGGSTWSNVYNSFYVLISKIIISPNDSNKIYAGTHGSILVSSNGGASWPFPPAFQHGVQNLEIDPKNDQTLYATTFDSAYKTTTGGVTWIPITNALLSAQGYTVSSFATNPNSPNIIYAGTWYATNGGIQKSTTGGTLWDTKNNGLTNTDISSIAIDPSNSSLVYATTNYGKLFISTNSGDSWMEAYNKELPNSSFISKLVIDPLDGNTFYAVSSSGLYKSTNGGISWMLTNSSLAYSSTYEVPPVAFDSNNSQIVYIGTLDGNILKSTTGGTCGNSDGNYYNFKPTLDLCIDGRATEVFGANTWTWSCLGANGGTNASCSANIITYNITFQSGGNGILTGTTSQIVNYGDSTKNVTAVPARGYHFVNWTGTNGFITTTANSLAVNNVTTAMTVTANFDADPVNGSCGSANGKSTPIVPTLYLCSSLGSASIPALNTGTFRWDWTCPGNYGGITANCFAPMIDTIPPTLTSFEIPATAIFKKIPITNISANDNAAVAGYLVTETSTAPSATAAGWSTTAPTSYTFSNIADGVATPKTLYAWAKDAAGNVSSPVSATTTITVITTADIWQTVGGVVGDVRSITFDPTDNQTVYVGTWANGIYRTTDGGVSWRVINGAMLASYGAGAAARAIVVDPSNNQTIYAGTSMGLFKSTDGGGSWVWTWTIAWNEVKSINSLVIDPANSQTLFAGCGSYGVSKSTDGGVTWTAVNNGIPTGVLAQSLIMDPTDSQTLYIATWTAGVLKTTNGGALWNPVNNGLTQTMILSLTIDPANSQTIYAAANYGTLFKSTNGGTSWSPAINGSVGGTGIIVNAATVNPSNSQTLYVGTLNSDGATWLAGAAKSTNGGATWNWARTGLTGTNFNTIKINRSAATTVDPVIFAGTDAGLFKATVSTPPTVTAFSIPATSRSLTVGITTLTASDNIGVTGYLVTETPDVPSATADGWNTTKPDSHIFTGIPSGMATVKTLYAWARDIAGNVSSSQAASTTITLPYVTGIAISGISSLNEGGSATYSATASWDDGSTSSVTPAWSVSPSIYGTITAAGLLTTLAVPGNQTIIITAVYAAGGNAITGAKSVTIINVPYPAALAIDGVTTVNESSTSTYSATVTWDDGSTSTVTPTWSIASTIYAQINSSTGVLTTRAVSADQSVMVTAGYTAGGVTKTVTKSVTISNVPYPTALAITGSASVNENSTATYSAAATWDDGSTSAVTPTWSVSPTTYASTTASGLLTTLAVPTNQTISIIANFTAGGITKSISKTVTIVNVPYPTDIAITGQNSVNEGSANTYNATVTWDDGSTGSVIPIWSITPSIYATINSNGLLTALTVPSNQSVSVIASVTAGGITKTATKIVTIVNIPYPTDLVITGSDSVSQGSTATYSATATWDDGSASSVSPTWSVTPTTYASLNADGFLTTLIVPSNQTVTVTARFTAGGITKTATKSVTITFVDNTAPTLTLSALADGAYTKTSTLNVSGTVTDSSGIKGLTVNGAAVTVNTDGSFSTAVQLVTGANVITVVATDNANNQKVATRTINFDSVAPVVTITAPADNSAVAQSPVTVSGSVNENATVALKVNNGASQALPVNGNDFTTSAALAVGLNTIELTATDLAGNPSSAKRTVTYDNTKPTLAVTVPSQDITTNQSTLTLQGTVSDSLSAVTVSITMDGQTFTPAVTAGAFQQQLTFTTLKQYAIVVTATDQAGNSSTVQRNVIFDGMSGDVNGDKTINVFDALLTLQYAVGLVEHTTENNAKYLATADVAPLDTNGKPKGDGVVNVFDALAILRHAVGLDAW